MMQLQKSAIGSRGLTTCRVGTARPTLIVRPQAKVRGEVDVQPSPPKPAAAAPKRKRSAQLDALYAISGEFDEDEEPGPPSKANNPAVKKASAQAPAINEGFGEEPNEFFENGGAADYSMDDDDAFDWRDKKEDEKRAAASHMGSWDESFDETEYHEYVSVLEGENKGKGGAPAPKTK